MRACYETGLNERLKHQNEQPDRNWRLSRRVQPKVRIRRGVSTWLYYPDASIICESNAQTEQFQDQPNVIVEVLSASTRAIDFDEKVNNYLTIESLQMYLILEQHEPHAVLFRRTPEGFLRESVEGIDLSVPFTFLGFTIPMAEFYDGVDFTLAAIREEEQLYDLTY